MTFWQWADLHPVMMAVGVVWAGVSVLVALVIAEGVLLAAINTWRMKIARKP